MPENKQMRTPKKLKFQTALNKNIISSIVVAKALMVFSSLKRIFICSKVSEEVEILTPIYQCVDSDFLSL